MDMWRVGLIFLMVWTAVASADVGRDERQGANAGPATAPAANQAIPPVDPYDQIVLTRTPRSETSGQRGGAASADGVFTLGRVTLALGVVLACIFGLRWASRHLLNLPTAGSGGAIQVLCRSTVSPRQQLMLVQVGRRLVLVANCGTQMNPLCEISDPDEIAGVMGQIYQKKSGAAGGAFSSLFRKEAAPYEELSQEPAGAEETQEKSEPALDETREELTGLLEKVRTMSRHFRRT